MLMRAMVMYWLPLSSRFTSTCAVQTMTLCRWKSACHFSLLHRSSSMPTQSLADRLVARFTRLHCCSARSRVVVRKNASLDVIRVHCEARA